jgi:hypothetical protein
MSLLSLELFLSVLVPIGYLPKGEGRRHSRRRQKVELFSQKQHDPALIPVLDFAVFLTVVRA